MPESIPQELVVFLPNVEISSLFVKDDRWHVYELAVHI
jgi:hypothetical protein